MNSSSSLLREEPPLPEFTENVRRNVAISWYRTPLPATEIKSLHAKSDLLGFAQTLGYLGVYVVLAGLAIWSGSHWPWWATVALVFGTGTVASFLPNAVHELGHGTVFKTKALNVTFCRLFSFLEWNNHEIFQASHTRHHRYTLHPPDDLEVVLPVRLMIWHFVQSAVFNVPAFRRALCKHARLARGRFEGEWELTLFPESAPGKRAAAVRWSRIVLAGHATILGVSALLGWWMVPVVVSLAPFCGGWLFFLCNNTQHIGLQDHVADFRLCCRTFTLNPLVRFLYWHMNYHTEHHMYAAVPCYHLGRLHRLIRHDLPPTPHGLVAVWREIGAILARQRVDPSYQHVPSLPSTAARSVS